MASLRLAASIVFAGFLALSGCASLETPFLKASDQFPIAYRMHRAEEPRGAVLLVHGLGTSRHEWYTFEKALRREGWTTLAMDLRGHGESIFLGNDEIRWTEMTEAGRISSVRDVQAAAAYMKKVLPEAQGSLWIAGSSFGSSLALRYAVTDSGISGLILLSPGLNYGGVEISEAAQAYRQRPVFIAASRDDFGAVRAAETLAAMMPSESKKVALREKAWHGSAMLEASPDLEKEVLQWLNEAASVRPKTISG